MKKSIFISAVLILLVAGSAFAVDQKNTGCGLGCMVFQGQNGLVSQVFAATTNGTFGNQTFGITSGTLNCEKPKTLVQNEKLNRFVADNMDSLATDIARGNGEYLNTLAVLMDIPEGKRAPFYTLLQSNFSRIYTSTGVTHLEVLGTIDSIVNHS